MVLWSVRERRMAQYRWLQLNGHDFRVVVSFVATFKFWENVTLKLESQPLSLSNHFNNVYLYNKHSI